MTCTKYFWATDQHGDSLPFTVTFILEVYEGGEWVYYGMYNILSGSYHAVSGLKDHPQQYKAKPRYPPSDDWTKPNDKTLTCRSSDITFVYQKPEPVPETVIVDVHVVDQDSAPVPGSNVTIPNALGATTIATNTSGVAAGFTLTKGNTFTAIAAPPTGYTSNSGSAVSFTATQTGAVYLTLTKTPTTGTLQVKARDAITEAYLSNVAVYVDYTYRGITLGSIGLIIPGVPIGLHTVMLVATGYNSKYLDTFVDANGTVLDEGMTPSNGTLAVGSTPHGASIYVNDVYRGVTPDPASPYGQYNYITLPAGTYNVKLTLAGYQDATTTAQVTGGLTTYYSPVLEAATGTVYVTAKDPDGNAMTGAEIYVDGVATGVLTPGTVTVSAGERTIIAKKDV
jgi:hypothetical protein